MVAVVVEGMLLLLLLLLDVKAWPKGEVYIYRDLNSSSFSGLKKLEDNK